MQKACLAMVLLLCGGCATVSGRTQYVAVDSLPRGIEVRDLDHDGQLVGVTPFFVALRRTTSLNWQLRRGDTIDIRNISCGYRVGDSLLGNVVPGAIGAVVDPLAGIGVLAATNLVDLVTRSAWGCPKLLRLPPVGTVTPEPPATTEDSPPAPPCPVYVVAPPRVDEARIAELAFLRFRNELAAAGSCARVVDSSVSNALFLTHGVSHYTPFHYDRYPRENLNELGAKTGATHLVELAFEPGVSHSDVRPTALDLFTFEQQTLPEFELDVPPALLERQTFYGLLVRVVQIVPDTITAGLALRRPDYEGVRGTRVTHIERLDEPGSGTAGGLGFSFTTPPEQEPLWSIYLRFVLRGHAGLEGRRLTIETPATGTTRIAETHLIFGSLTIGPRLGLMLPIGELSIFAHGGVIQSFNWEASAGSRGSLDVSGIGGVALTRFIGDRVLVRLGINIAQSTTPMVDRPDYQLSRIISPTVSIGYYYPELREYLRTFL